MIKILRVLGASGLAVICAGAVLSQSDGRAVAAGVDNALGRTLNSGVPIQVLEPRPDLTTSLKTSPLLSPNQNVTITATVTNNGTASAPASDYMIIIKNGHAPRQVMRTFKRKIRALEPGDHYTFSFTVKLSLGLYEVCGTSDRKRKTQDADRTNNEFCLMIEGK